MSKQPSQSKMQPLVDGEIPPHLQARLHGLDEQNDDAGGDRDYWEEEHPYTSIDNEVEVARIALPMALLPSYKMHGMRLRDIDPRLDTALISISFAIGFLALIGLLVASAMGGIVLVILAAIVAFNLFIMHEIILLENKDGGELIFLINLGRLNYYRSHQYFEQRMIFPDMEDNDLNFPPSIACLVQTPSFRKATPPRDLSNLRVDHKDDMGAAGMFRGMVLCFWALGNIHLRRQVSQYSVLGGVWKRQEKWVIQMGRVPDSQLVGRAEIGLFNAIDHWENKHAFMTDRITWQPAPTLPDVMKLMGRESSRLLTEKLMRTTLQTIIERKLGIKDRRNRQHLVFEEDVHAAILNDAAKIQSIAEETRDIFYPIAVDLERSIANMYMPGLQ